MQKEISLTIDGNKISVSSDTTILTAASKAGVDIPHLCYEPKWKLPPTGACRLCLVEVEGARSLAAACCTPATDGMIVRTDTENLREIRTLIIELLLSDHPADCMTCEQSGNCDLQKYAYEFGVRQPSFTCEPIASDPIEDGPAIAYDHSKCILCGRCVQVCQDVQVSGAIDFYGRGFDTRISIPPGQTRKQSTCVECGNCINVCPTGALYFPLATGKGRKWEMKQTETICPYCGCGCTLVLQTKDNRIIESVGKAQVGVNEGMLCVKGRFGCDFIGREDRLTEPLIRKEGKLVPASWDEALSYVAENLTRVKKESGPDAIAGLASAKCTNEENYIFQKFIRAAIGTNNVDHCARLCHASTVAGLAKAFGSGAMTNSIEDFDITDCVFIIGSNTTECHPIIGSAIKRAVLEREIPIIVADPRKIELTDYAEIHLRQKGGTDVALINAMINVILAEGLEDKKFISERTEGFDELKLAVEPYAPEKVEAITGVPADDIRRAARIYANASAGSIVYSMGITQHITGTDNVLSLANLAMVTGNIGKPGSGVNPLRGQNNVQGACDLGSLPNVYPGYQKVDDKNCQSKFSDAWGATLSDKPGLTVVEIMNAAHAGDIKALCIMGENPMMSDPDTNHVRESLKNLDFIVVLDIFLTETAELADVVLPAAAFAEKDGTFTNTERRIQRVRKAVNPPGSAMADWKIMRDLSGKMGYEMPYKSASEIQDEIASLTPNYGGVTHQRLESGTLQWPCTHADHPGTPFLHKEKFTHGLGKFHAVEFIPAAELPDDEYPFLLSTGRMLEHFHTGSMTRRSVVLDELVPAAAIEINPADAEKIGITDGQCVTVSSRRGTIEVQSQVTPRADVGSVFLTFHFHEASANILTIAELDPIAKIPELKVCAVKIVAGKKNEK